MILEKYSAAVLSFVLQGVFMLTIDEIIQAITLPIRFLTMIGESLKPIYITEDISFFHIYVTMIVSVVLWFGFVTIMRFSREDD